MCLLNWQNKKFTCILSTIHNSENVEIKSRNKTVLKSKAIAEYNLTMEGVAYLTSVFLIIQQLETSKRNIKKIFRHLLDQVIWKFFILYHKKGRTLRQLELRMKLVEGLVQNNEESNVPHKNMDKKSVSILRFNCSTFSGQCTFDETKNLSLSSLYRL